MNTAISAEIGNRLKDARRASARGGKPMSQKELAEALGLSLRAYQNYERGDRPISQNLISAVMSVFGISPYWLLLGDGAMFRADAAAKTKRMGRDHACTDSELIAAAYLINGAVEMTPWLYAGLCSRIDATGKRVGEMTVDELLRAIREHRNHMERIEAEVRANG
ncbi:MAG: helix-turn-helix transcriptional regulator [Pseudomonadota bacterium]